MAERFIRFPSGWQWRGRYLWVSWLGESLTIWFNVAGRKPLAHLPKWRRRLLHLPSIRFRLWPRPWNQAHAYKPGSRTIGTKADLCGSGDEGE